MKIKKKSIIIKGIPMSPTEYRDFVKYLNTYRVQKFTKHDVSNFLIFRMTGDFVKKMKKVY